MANLKEAAEWVDGIYQLEKTDKVMGGEDGISNLQAKQLGNRTAFLKKELDSTKETVEGLKDVSPETMLGVVALAGEAAMKARQLEQTIDFDKTIFTQRGEVFIKNRGVIEGCTVSKSSDAARNLSLSTGRVFLGAVVIPVKEQANVAVVPSNTTSESIVCWCYLQKGTDGQYGMKCTLPSAEAPDDSIVLYKVTIPSGNTAENDPTLSSVTLTDVRRVESAWPKYMVNASYAQIAFDVTWPDADYDIYLDVVSYVGSGFQQGNIYAAERATNGFKIYTNGAVDSMQVRWKAMRRKV